MNDRGQVGEAEVEFVRCRDLPADQRLRAASLVLAALPELYAPLDPDLVLSVIAEQFSETGTEISDGEAALIDGKTVGIACGYPAEQMPQRQGSMLHHLLSTLSGEAIAAFVGHLRKFRAQIPSIANGGYYLARIAVDPAHRGSGVADRLLVRFLAGEPGGRASLHVRADNVRAIAFYSRHGFAFHESGTKYAIMLRN